MNFEPNLSKKGISGLKRNSEHHHQIQHIGINSETKFQLSQTVLIFCSELVQKGYFQSETYYGLRNVSMVENYHVYILWGLHEFLRSVSP